MQEFEVYHPWGKGAMQPQYDQRGDTKRFPHAKQEGFIFTDPKFAGKSQVGSFSLQEFPR